MVNKRYGHALTSLLPHIQAAAASAREALTVEVEHLRAALVEARDALLAVDAPGGAGGRLQEVEGELAAARAKLDEAAAELERQRADCDREILIVQESYESEVARLRQARDKAMREGAGSVGERLAEAEQVIAWLREELTRVDALHSEELASVRQESAFAIAAAEDRAAATIAKTIAWHNVQQRDEVQRKQVSQGRLGLG